MRRFGQGSEKQQDAHWLWPVAVIVVLMTILAGSIPLSAQSCQDDVTTLQISCPALPVTNASGTITDGILDYDIWAWNSFIALNWPALVPSENNNQRGFPDLTQQFDQAGDTLTVWETYKEKREVFLADPFTREAVPDPKPLGWNAEPEYGPSDAQIPCCTGATCDTGEFGRDLANSSKLNSAFDTFDETAEVASEARETDTVLCQGHASDCGVNGKPVGPRVWRGQPSSNNPVLYEVKVNYDFFKYVKDFTGGPLWVQHNAIEAAKSGLIHLPLRTSNANRPNQPRTGPDPKMKMYGINEQAVLGYKASDALTAFKKVTSSTSETPPLSGSVHLKAAWMQLSGADDNTAYYHTVNAFYYTTDSETGQICKQPGEDPFGLVGLHIIQRIHESKGTGDNADKGAGPRGGTFVFATWEHRYNDKQGYTYANLYPTTTDTPDPYPNYNASGVETLPLNRVYDIPSSTMAANEQVWTALNCAANEQFGFPAYGDGTGTSVWCNYMLVGVQYQAIDTPSPQPTLLTSLSDPSIPIDPEEGTSPVVSMGQSYYLANLVIESNVGLQQFQGLPPNQTPIDHFSKPKPPPGTSGTSATGVTNTTGDSYDHTAKNLAFRIAPNQDGSQAKQNIPTGALNMGGCMGCHGVAQLNGYAFSFVLLGNQGGAAPDTQGTVDIPPPSPKLYYAFTGTNKKLYIGSSASGDAGSFTFAVADNGSNTTNTAPALTSFNGKFYYAFTGMNKKLYIGSSASGAAGTFTFGVAANGGYTTNVAPALASFNDKLYYAFRGTNQGNLWIGSSTSGAAGSFKFGHPDNGSNSTNTAPTMASFNGKLYYAFTGTNEKLYIGSSASGNSGSFTFAVAANGGYTTNVAPALASFNNKLYYAFRGTNQGNLWIGSSTSGNAGSFTFGHPDNGSNSTNTAPALASFIGRLYYAFTGTNQKFYIGSSTNGNSGTFTFDNADDGSNKTNEAPALVGGN